MPLPLSFRWPDEFVAAIDKARGDVPRTAFVRRAVEAALGTDAARSASSESDNGTSNPAVGGSISHRSSASAGSTPAPAPPRASAKTAPVNHAMERQRKLNDAKYGRKS